MKGLLILAKLTLRQMVGRWPRTLLGVLGIAVSVCLVMWIIRGYEVASSGSASRTSESRFDVVISPQRPMMTPGGPRGGGPRPRPTTTAPAAVGQGLIEQLASDPEVAEVVPCVAARVRIVDPAPAVELGPFSGRGSLIGTSAAEPPVKLQQGRWLKSGAADEAVASARFLANYGLTLGGKVTVGGVGGECELTIVGVLPAVGRAMFSPTSADLMVAASVADTVNGYSGRVSAACVVLHDPDKTDAFVKRWAGSLANVAPPLDVKSQHSPADDPMAGRMMGMLAVQANNAVILAFLAACFIIFVTLNAGVRERVREHAMLRAIVMSRWQLVFTIVVEGLLTAAAGWAIGIGLAQALLRVGNMLAEHLRFFQAGAFADYPLGWTSIWIAGLCAGVGALAASILPAWQAARLRPLEVLGGPGEGRNRRFPYALVGIGLVLVLVNPVLVLLANVEPFKSVIAKTYTTGFAPPLLSSAFAVAGLAMVTPLVVLVIERLLGPVLAAVLRLDRRFLRQQLTGQLWRTVGTTVSLSAGLGLFVTSLVWGYSMLVPFTPDDSMPRMLVSVLPAGLPADGVDKLKKVDGVVGDECVPMAVEQPRLTDATLARKEFESVDPSQEHVLMLGVDPASVIAGSSPAFKFQFVQGDRASAARKLAGGHCCLVPEEFATKTGLKLGDKFSVEVPNKPKESIEYEIAGVVYVPGWNWWTKFAEIRRRAGRALAVMFADCAQVKNDYGIDRISFFWMNVDAAVSPDEMIKRLEPLADSYANVRVEVPGSGTVNVADQYVRITERNDLTERLFRRANDVIWGLTKFPLLVLVIASLAVFNAIMASVRSRYWQFGVLRGVGLSQWQLFRLVISESVMMFLAAAVLSLGSGVLLAWCGTHICTYFFYFGGVTPPLVLPWAGLAQGFGIAFGMCLLAGLLPAWQVASKEPLGFIQAGRLA